MEYLFDPDKPHFGVWRTIYNIDTFTEGPLSRFQLVYKSHRAPLYYAALCRFHDLVEHLIIKYPQDVNTSGGRYVRPLVAALAWKHFRTAEFLCHNSANLHCQSADMMTPLHSAAINGDLEVVQKLIEYGADINAKDDHRCTPIHLTSELRDLKDCNVILLLVKHGADVNVRRKDGSTPLHMALSHVVPEAACLLLEHGGDVKAENNNSWTALRVAEEKGREEVKKLLLEHEAK
jgi:ankyrin repeat protein